MEESGRQGIQEPRGRHPCGAGPAGRRSGEGLFRPGAAGVRGAGSRACGRKHGEQPLPGRFHLPKSANPAERDRGELPAWGEKTVVPGEHVHLSPGGPAADEGGLSADLAPGVHERAVRHRENSRAEDVREFQSAIRDKLHRRDADQPVRPERQFPFGEQPRDAGDDPEDILGQVPGGRGGGLVAGRHERPSRGRRGREEAFGGDGRGVGEVRCLQGQGRAVGYRFAEAGVPVERGDGGRLRVRAGARGFQGHLSGRGQGNPELPHQHRHGGRDFHKRFGGPNRLGGRVRGRDSFRFLQAGRDTPEIDRPVQTARFGMEAQNRSGGRRGQIVRMVQG